VDTTVKLIHSPHARWVDGPEGELAILNLKQGVWTFLDGMGALVWPLFAAGTSAADVYDTMAEQYGVTRTAAAAKYGDTVAELTQSQQLVPVWPDMRPAQAKVPSAESFGRQSYGLERPGTAYKLLGLATLPVALLLSNRSPATVHRFLACGRRFSTIPTVEQAARLAGGVRYAGKWLPTRLACLEASLATVLAGMLVGRMPVLCIGPRFSPLAHHTWLEAYDAEGIFTPVGEVESEMCWPYRAVIRE
jgi:hypothetical protein